MISPQLLSILQQWFPSAARRPGPAGYTDAQIVACLVIGARLQARSLRHLVRLLEASPALVEALGLPKAPSVATLSRRLRRLGPQLLLLCRRLSRRVDPSWIGAMDATGIRTRARGSGWGWSRPFGLFCELKLHAVVTPSGLLRDFVLTPAAVRESRVFFRGTGLTVLLADRGYDSERLARAYAQAGVRLFARPRRLGIGGPRTPYRRKAAVLFAMPAGRRLYRLRGAIERFFGWLKRHPVLVTPVASVAHLERVLAILWLELLLARSEAGSDEDATKFAQSMAL
ncbi:transposase [Thermaerobacter litoralis]